MKCKFKSILALALALMMCVTMLPTAAFAATAESAPWDGSIAESIPVEGNTYTITTPAQLAKLAVDVNGGNSYSDKIVKLAADINLGGKEFTPIGSWNKSFAGTFDGKKSDSENYTISNIKIAGNDTYFRAGLFGCVMNGTVQNLTINNIEVTNSSSKNSSSSTDNINESATGAAVATLRSGSIINVHVIGDSSVSGHLRTGGIVGDTRGTKSYVTDCTNAATVTSDNLYLGGIVGAAHDVSSVANDMGSTISGCTNSGAVIGTGNATNVGGIVGYADRAYVKQCTNEETAAVTGMSNYGTGGIVGCNAYNPIRLFGGLITREPTVATKIESCTNEADVTGGFAGGILGAYIVVPSRTQPSNKLDCMIIDCVNTGDVIGRADRCGAIFGYQISYKNGDGKDYVDNLIVVIEGGSYNCKVGTSEENLTLATVPTNSPYATIVSK